MKSCACIDTYCGLCYNKRKKGGVFVRKILDKLFENKKLSMLIPIISAAVIYLLFILFGTAEDKVNDMIAIPFVCAVWFFGSFLVIFIQVKNPRCPEKFLDFCELMALGIFVFGGVIETVSAVISGFQNFNFICCVGLVTYSSISWAHNKREKIADKEE